MTLGRETRAMRKKSGVFARRAVVVACGGSLASVLPRAIAQQPSEPGTLSIEVTGTHLKRTDSETAWPLQAFTREDLQKGGIQTVQDLPERVSANYFATEHGGGDNGRVNATLGLGDLAADKYNVFVSADYFKQDSLKASQRDRTKTAYIPSLGVDRTSSNSFPANIRQSGDFGT